MQWINKEWTSLWKQLTHMFPLCLAILNAQSTTLGISLRKKSRWIICCCINKIMSKWEVTCQRVSDDVSPKQKKLSNLSLQSSVLAEIHQQKHHLNSMNPVSETSHDKKKVKWGPMQMAYMTLPVKTKYFKFSSSIKIITI